MEDGETWREIQVLKDYTGRQLVVVKDSWFYKLRGLACWAAAGPMSISGFHEGCREVRASMETKIERLCLW